MNLFTSPFLNTVEALQLSWRFSVEQEGHSFLFIYFLIIFFPCPSHSKLGTCAMILYFHTAFISSSSFCPPNSENPKHAHLVGFKMDGSGLSLSSIKSVSLAGTRSMQNVSRFNSWAFLMTRFILCLGRFAAFHLKHYCKNSAHERPCTGAELFRETLEMYREISHPELLVDEVWQ